MIIAVMIALGFVVAIHIARGSAFLKADSSPFPETFLEAKLSALLAGLQDSKLFLKFPSDGPRSCGLSVRFDPGILDLLDDLLRAVYLLLRDIKLYFVQTELLRDSRHVIIGAILGVKR
jgi:hypothetical protein